LCEISLMSRIHHFPGFLIAIEGIDGSGKTTQAQHVQSMLQGRKLTVIRTKEPTTSRWGQILRDSALTGRLSLEEELETFIKDRKEHVETQINPALREGHTVIVDRYYFSSMAYQGAQGMNPRRIMDLNEQFAPEPDLLVLLDLEPKIGMDRIRTRDDRAKYFKQTGLLKKAREIFLDIKKPYLLKLDARDHPNTLRKMIARRFSTIYARRMANAPGSIENILNPSETLFGKNPI
jgi:dTMP kinase